MAGPIRTIKHRGSHNVIYAETWKPIDSYIYVMKNYAGDYKIGISENPKQRLTSIDSANSRPVELIFVSEIKHWAMEAVEKEIHRILRSHGCWLKNEWFDLSDEMLENVYEWIKEDTAKIKEGEVVAEPKPTRWKEKTRSTVVAWHPSRYAA